MKCAWWNIVHPERLEVPMLKARVGGEGVLREGIRREGGVNRRGHDQ